MNQGNVPAAPGTAGQWHFGLDGLVAPPAEPAIGQPQNAQGLAGANAQVLPLPGQQLQQLVGIAEGRNNNAPESEFVKFGRGYSWWCNAGDCFVDILMIGGEQRAVDVPLSDNERYYVSHYNKVKAALPTLAQAIRDRGPNALQEIGREMNRGRQNARSEDNNNVRSTIHHFYSFKEKLPPRQKERGFNHPECMFLLAPADIDLNDAEARRKLELGKTDVTSGDFSRLLYEGCRINRHDIFQGFLLNEILLRVGLLIAFGKATALEGPDADRSATRGIANIHGYTAVTIDFIAYTAMLANHALSSRSQLVFNSGAGPFTYVSYYKSIIACFKKMPEYQQTEVLDRWNRYVYGSTNHDIEVNIEEATEQFPPGSIAAQMFAQA